MEDFVIDEIHTSIGWRITRPGTDINIYTPERSHANEVVKLLNAGLHAAKDAPAEAQASDADPTAE